MKNALTIDLEDYFHVTAFSAQVRFADWDSLPSRVQLTTHKLLDILDEGKSKATFFVLGWVAERFPALIREVADRGHEIACHSYAHRFVYSFKIDEFREDTRKAKQLIEDASGQRVCGYRAPSFSIRRDSLWALGVLAELGFTYDSSIAPVLHPDYGIQGVPRFPFRINTENGDLTEFPISTVQWAEMRSPIAGGAYLRLLPYWYTKAMIAGVNRAESQPASVYLHPWELDPEQPRMHGGITSKIRHYLGLNSTEKKLRLLLRDFDFVPVSTILAMYRGRDAGDVLHPDGERLLARAAAGSSSN